METVFLRMEDRNGKGYPVAAEKDDSMGTDHHRIWDYLGNCFFNKAKLLVDGSYSPWRNGCPMRSIPWKLAGQKDVTENRRGI